MTFINHHSHSFLDLWIDQLFLPMLSHLIPTHQFMSTIKRTFSPDLIHSEHYRTFPPNPSLLFNGFLILTIHWSMTYNYYQPINSYFHTHPQQCTSHQFSFLTYILSLSFIINPTVHFQQFHYMKSDHLYSDLLHFFSHFH